MLCFWTSEHNTWFNQGYVFVQLAILKALWSCAHNAEHFQGLDYSKNVTSVCVLCCTRQRLLILLAYNNHRAKGDGKHLLGSSLLRPCQGKSCFVDLSWCLKFQKKHHVILICGAKFSDWSRQEFWLSGNSSTRSIFSSRLCLGSMVIVMILASLFK